MHDCCVPPAWLPPGAMRQCHGTRQCHLSDTPKLGQPLERQRFPCCSTLDLVSRGEATPSWSCFAGHRLIRAEEEEVCRSTAVCSCKRLL